MNYYMGLLLFSIALPALSQMPKDADFFTGTYLLVGKALDSEHTFSGKVEFFREREKLKFRRSIEGGEIVGEAQLQPVAGGDTTVLRLSYREQGTVYEQTCLWQSDLDNYPRISCYLYRPGVATHQPGLEVLFHQLAGK